MHKHLDVLSAAAGLILAAATLAQEPPEGGPPPTFVRAAPVKTETLQPRRRVTGTLRAVAESQVATIEPGRVHELPIDAGQIVRAGETLARLDTRRLDLDKKRLEGRRAIAEAVIVAREAERDIRARDVENLSRLAERNASNPKEKADAESELIIAIARLTQASSDLEVIETEVMLIETRLRDKTITAPFDGVVVRKLTERGQWVAEGDAIAELVAITQLDAWLDVPQYLVAEIRRPEVRVDLVVDATGERLEGLRTTVVPQADQTSRTVPAYVRIDNDRTILAPGMSVTGWIPTGDPKPFLTVPRDAILRRETGTSVFIARPAGPDAYIAMPAPVHVLFETGAHAAIRSAQLDEGVLVVIEGNERLFPMMPIGLSGDRGVTAGAPERGG